MGTRCTSSVRRWTVTAQEIEWCRKISNERGWPYLVTGVAYEVWGGRIFNSQSRFVRGLHRRILHALETWEEKYGPFNDAQEDYAHKLLVYAINRGATEGKDQVEKYRYSLHTMAQLVNHEKAHAGFTRRRDETPEHLYGDLLKRVPV